LSHVDATIRARSGWFPGNRLVENVSGYDDSSLQGISSHPLTWERMRCRRLHGFSSSLAIAYADRPNEPETDPSFCVVVVRSPIEFLLSISMNQTDRAFDCYLEFRLPPVDHGPSIDCQFLG